MVFRRLSRTAPELFLAAAANIHAVNLYLVESPLQNSGDVDKLEEGSHC